MTSARKPPTVTPLSRKPHLEVKVSRVTVEGPTPVIGDDPTPTSNVHLALLQPIQGFRLRPSLVTPTQITAGHVRSMCG